MNKLLFSKKDKELYSMLIHKNKKGKVLNLQRPQIVEIEVESKYCESSIQ